MNTNTTSRAVALAAALTMLISACGESGAGTTTTIIGSEPTSPATTTTTTTTTLPETTTTTVPETTTTEGPATPDANATLDAIRSAAENGDLNALAELALSFDTLFTASFGQDFTDPTELAAFWATFEDPTVPEVVLGLLDAGYTRTFANNEDGSQVGINVTPAVMGEDSTEADRARLESIFGEEVVTGWYADGMYLGWRLGVDDDGAWRFLVFGD